MKVFECGNCGQSVEKLSNQNSFKRDEKQCCSTCGGYYYEKEITPEQKKRNDKRHHKWMYSRIFWFEVIFGLFLIVMFGMSMR